MKKTHELIATLFLLSIGMQGCALVQNLREDLEDDSPKRSIASDFDYNSPENRNLPPPPATVQDDRISAVAGTPIDFSGIRAKSGRITKNDFINDVNKNENSLWSEDGQQNYLFARNKLKANGDLVTIKIEDGLRTDMVMEVKKLLPPEFRDRDIVVPGISKDVPEEAATDANRAVAGAASGVEKKAAEPVADSITAEVLERYPNGNLRIRGIKSIPFKHKTRNMDVIAIVKAADVDEHDQIVSSKFLEHKVELYR